MIPTVRYRAVLFDLDDTLIPEEPAIEAGFAAVAERVLGASSPEHVRSLWDAADQVLRDEAPARDYLAAVHITASDLLHGSLIAGGPQSDSLRAFVPYYLEHAFDPILPEPARPATRELVQLSCRTRLAALTVYPDTVSVLERLSDEVPLALVTNGLSGLQRNKLELTGLAAIQISRTTSSGDHDTVASLQELGSRLGSARPPSDRLGAAGASDSSG